MKKSDQSHRIRLLRRTAKEARDYRVVMKILSTALALLLLLLAILYIWAALYKRTGSFTVSLDKVEMTKYGLTLAETRDMRYNTSHLNADIVKDMTNIAEEWLPDNLDAVDGEHNGENYLAYTFYLQNAGEVPLAYEYAVSISNITNGLDEAIRIRLYRDGVATTYAKTKSNGGGPESEFVKEFYSVSDVVRERVDEFVPGQTSRFTIVIWIEGNDPDCTDPLIGGRMKIDMNIRAIH